MITKQCKQFVNFLSDAESADVSALNAEDFADVTLVKMTLLMVCEDSEKV